MKRLSGGFTLIELIVSIVILSTIGLTIVGLLAFIGRTSAQSLSQTQSAIVANAYLQNILSKQFGGGTDEIEAYDGQAHKWPRDGSNTPIVGLHDYHVAISVEDVTFGSGSNSVPAKLVTVTITDPMGDLVRLSGLRTER